MMDQRDIPEVCAFSIAVERRADMKSKPSFGKRERVSSSMERIGTEREKEGRNERRRRKRTKNKETIREERKQRKKQTNKPKER